MPKFHFSTEDDDSSYESYESYESDDGTTYVPVNTAHYKLAKFDPLKPISKRSISIQLTPEGLTYFLYNKKKLQSGHIAFAEIPPEVAELRHATKDFNWHEILTKYSTEIIDIILKKGHGIRGYLATGTYSLARRFSTTSGDSRKTKVILEPIKCDYKESRKKYLFFKTLYPTDESYYIEDSSKQTYRLVLPEIMGTLYGDLSFITDPNEQKKLFLATLKALKECHSKKIICLDLNPYNIKYRAPPSEDSLGLSSLIDGGFSNELGEIIDTEFFRCETLEQITKRRISCPYFAPECWYLDSPPLAQESMDIYSMGKVLAQILNPLAPELVPFITACCHQEPSKRVTLEELEYNLEHLFEANIEKYFPLVDDKEAEMQEKFELQAITAHPPLPLKKNTDGLYPLPTMRCGVLPYYIDKDNQIIWGCVESNRVGPITITPPAGIQDIIAMKDGQRFHLEVGKPFPDLQCDPLKGFIGVLFRSQAYQDITHCLIENGFNLYIEPPLKTALHETREEHGVDLQDTGRDKHLLNTLWELPIQKLSGKQGATAQYICVARLNSCEGVLLNNTTKIEEKIRRNLGRFFYEKGCWGTLDSFKSALAVEKAKFCILSEETHYSLQQMDLITGVLAAGQDAIEMLERLELLIRSDLEKLDSPRQPALKAAERVRPCHAYLSTAPIDKLMIEEQRQKLADSFLREGNPSDDKVCMQVLSGFMAALGVAAVAIAFTMLNAATFGTVGVTVACIGLASLLAGCGFFKKSWVDCHTDAAHCMPSAPELAL